MNYVYDIFLNYNNLLYDVFEWNKDDKLTHIRKIPLLVIKSEDLHNFINKKVTIDMDFLNKIYQKTEIFGKKEINFLNYSFLASDKKELISFKIDKNGYINQYSKLLFNEEEEVLNSCKFLPFKEIKYKIFDDKNNRVFKTRNEEKIKKFIYDELKKIKKDYNKILFLYFECFGNLKVNNVLNELYQQLENNWEYVYIKFYDVLKIMAIKNK